MRECWLDQEIQNHSLIIFVLATNAACCDYFILNRTLIKVSDLKIANERFVVAAFVNVPEVNVTEEGFIVVTVGEEAADHYSSYSSFAVTSSSSFTPF